MKILEVLKINSYILKAKIKSSRLYDQNGKNYKLAKKYLDKDKLIGTEKNILFYDDDEGNTKVEVLLENEDAFG